MKRNGNFRIRELLFFSYETGNSTRRPTIPLKWHSNLKNIYVIIIENMNWEYYYLATIYSK